MIKTLTVWIVYAHCGVSKIALGAYDDESEAKFHRSRCVESKDEHLLSPAAILGIEAVTIEPLTVRLSDAEAS